MYEIKGSYRNVIKFDDDFFEKEKSCFEKKIINFLIGTN